MRTHRTRWPLVFALAIALAVAGFACVEVRLVKVSVIQGPASGGALTLRVDVRVDFEEQEADPSAAPAEPLNGQIGYVALAVPADVEVTGASLVAAADLAGEDGRRAMGASPQIARIYQREFPLDDGRRWVAFHVVLDRIEITRDHDMAIELRMLGVPQGQTTVLAAPSYLDDSGAITPANPTVLELTVTKDQALVRIVPPAAQQAGVTT